MGSEVTQNCLNCTNLLFSDTSDSGYRSGQEYFKVPPLERRVSRMDSYPVVEKDDVCEHWKPQGSIHPL